MKYKDQFFLLRDLIKESGLARIWVYQNNRYFGTNTSAYIVEQAEIPEIRICVADDKESTYKNSIADLLHEYGHVLDYKRYGKTKRYKQADMFYIKYGTTKSDYNILYKEPRDVRVSVVITEYMAWKFARKLRKLWEIQIEDETLCIEQSAHITSMIIKINERKCLKPQSSYECLRSAIRETGKLISYNDIRRLHIIIPEEKYRALLM